MKNFVVTIFAVAALTACKKMKHRLISLRKTRQCLPAESGMTVSDSSRMSNTTDTANTLSDQDKNSQMLLPKVGLWKS